MTQTSETEIATGAGLKNSPALGSVCTALGDILSDGIDVHRCQAAKALGRIGAPDSVPPLIKALLDEDEDVRTDAAEALLELADPKAGEQLFENLLGDPCTEVKLAAIETLAKIQDDRVIPWLRRMVKGRDEDIVWDEEEFFSSGWDDWVEIQVRAVKALAELKVAEAVPDIVAAIDDENAQDMIEAAFKALAKMGPDGVEALAGFLDRTDTRLRRRAASVLATIETETAQDALARALDDPSEEVRLAALRARGELFPDDPALAGMLADADVDVRALAVQLIGRHHPDTLRALLDDDAAKVQSAALAAYAKIDDGVADDLLVQRLCLKTGSPEIDVSVAASATLGAVAPDVARDELAKLLGDAKRPLAIRLGALTGLVAIGGGKVVGALVAVIDDEQRQIRLEAMSALAKLAAANADWPNSAGTALLAALRGEYDPEVDETAEAGATAVAAAAEEKTNNSEPGESAPADAPARERFPTSTLDSMLKDAPGIASVVGLPEEGIELSKNDMERLAMARRVVGKKKMSMAPKVVRHDDIRRYAARVLGNLDHEEVTLELAASLELDDTEMRLAAADSLARIGARAGGLPQTVTQALLGKLTADDRNLKLLSIRALAACGGDEIFDRVQPYLSDQDSFIRAEAVRSLTGRDRLRFEIDDLLIDPDPSVRMSAAEALAGVAGPEDIEPLVEFAFSFEGYHGRQTARLLRGLDADRASAAFLNILSDPERRRVWSVAIEALEELNQP